MEELINWNLRPSKKSKFKWINEQVKVDKIYRTSQIYDYASHLAYKMTKNSQLARRITYFIDFRVIF